MANLPSKQKNPISCPITFTPPSPNVASSPSATSTSTLIHKKYYIPSPMIVMFFHGTQRTWLRRHGDVRRRRGMFMAGISMLILLVRGIIFKVRYVILVRCPCRYRHPSFSSVVSFSFCCFPFPLFSFIPRIPCRSLILDSNY